MTSIYISLLAFLAVASPALAGEWTPLPPLPDLNGFAGSFAGISADALLVAGGANFPDKKPWGGGAKRWYDTVFVLDRPGGNWKIAGRLARPLAYGVSVTHGAGVICVGGNDASRHYADAFRVEWKANTVVITPLPALPKPLAYPCGALDGDLLYIAGGQEKSDVAAASRSVFAMDLSAAEPRWREIEPCPGAGRILAVAACFDGALWLIGGAELSPGEGGKGVRKYLKDTYRYRPTEGWRRMANLPHPMAAAPSPAPADSSGFYVLGGDDGSQVDAPPDRHQGFDRTILRYDSKLDRWLDAGKLREGRVTAQVVRWGDGWVIPSGEIRPAVRTAEVWSWSPGKQE